MAIEKAELAQMIELSRSGADVLFGALCVSAMSCVTDMQSDFLNDPDYVRTEGMPNAAKMVEMATDQICAVFPEMLFDDGEFDEEVKRRDGEAAINMLIRGLMNQIIKQRPDLMTLQFQPR